MNQSCFVQEHRLHDLPSHIPFSLICAVILCHKIFPPVCQFTKDFFQKSHELAEYRLLYLLNLPYSAYGFKFHKKVRDQN